MSGLNDDFAIRQARQAAPERLRDKQSSPWTLLSRDSEIP
jgi:hypothetical protein